MTPQSIIHNAQVNGICSLSIGTHIHSRDNMLQQQRTWPKGHKYRSFNFDSAGFWLIDSDFLDPVRIDGADDPVLVGLVEVIQ